MKILFFSISAVVYVMIVVFTFHKRREQGRIVSNKNNDADNNSTVTMITAESDNVSIYIAGSGRCIIDWGDGTSELQTLLSYPSQMYSHNYFGTSTRSITITCKKITHIGCYEQLSSLNVSGCTTLLSLTCYDTGLTSLDVSGCTALQYLTCFDTQLTNLDVSSCKSLSFLQCKFNSRLTNLDISGCEALLNVDCCYNGILETAS